MKKQLVIVGVVVLFFVVGFSGCTEEDSTDDTNEKFVTASLDTLTLTLDDLPEGYAKWSDDHDYSGESIQGMIPLEFYEIHFVFQDPENDTGYPWIGLSFYKFNSSKDANTVLQALSEQVTNSLNESKRTTPQTVEQIGNESIYELYQGIEGEYYKYQNATFSFIHFRMRNVVVYLFLEGMPNDETDYVISAIDYAKIVESRINASLE